MIKRITENPILVPQSDTEWEAFASFNPSVVKERGTIHLVYRAMSQPKVHRGVILPLSTIGYAKSHDGIYFTHRRQLIKPEYDWEAFGCEDPRVTKFEGRYFIFYTALSTYPFSKEGIKIAVAVTSDFENIIAKHPVTFFNSKAMALFPERLSEKIAAVLTVNTDMPPAKIALALFSHESEIWSKDYWEAWGASLNDHIIPLMRDAADQVEVGAPPIKTKDGWLLIYCYIKNYRSMWARIFGIEAVLLDLNNPKKIIGRTEQPLLTPEEDYEEVGNVPNVVFPSGALVRGRKLFIYYGASDTTSAVASADLKDILLGLAPKKQVFITKPTNDTEKLTRFEGNPIITPVAEFDWEAKATFNPAAIYEGGKIHIIYRAMSEENTSVFGYATSLDGLNIEERLTKPIYVPQEDFEQKKYIGNSGCEDPRITRINERFYICYTAFDGVTPRFALTSITVSDFLKRQWNFDKPVLLSPPGVDDKDACIFPKKINGKYVFLHRLGICICIEFVDSLIFPQGKWIGGEILFAPRANKWDNKKIGIASPPIETQKGWLLLYHGISERENIYRVGASLLALDNPTKIIARTDYPILEPKMEYEINGVVPNVVFPCGAVVLQDTLFVYYGGADKVVGVATANINDLVEGILLGSSN